MYFNDKIIDSIDENDTKRAITCLQNAYVAEETINH